MVTERSDLVALALSTCTQCAGSGLYEGSTCTCVKRGVFRAVMRKYRECSAGGHLLPLHSLEGARGPRGKVHQGRRHEEYLADVFLTAQRAVEPGKEWDIFRYHYLLGVDWKYCAQRLNMTRGNIFHMFYKIEAKLGRVFLETKPYAVFPIDEYFRPFTRTVDARPLQVPYARHPNGEPLRPPLARRAPQARSVPAPVPVVPMVPEPVPVLPAVSWDITDPAAVANHIRARFHVGTPPLTIANELNRLGVPAPDGTAWYRSSVKRALICTPRPRLQKAA